MSDDNQQHIEMMAAQILAGMISSDNEWEDYAATAVELAFRIRNRVDQFIGESSK